MASVTQIAFEVAKTSTDVAAVIIARADAGTLDVSRLKSAFDASMEFPVTAAEAVVNAIPSLQFAYSSAAHDLRELLSNIFSVASEATTTTLGSLINKGYVNLDSVEAIYNSAIINGSSVATAVMQAVNFANY